ncbi:U4/U6-U5 snRNP complex subunit prp31 [Orbilia oligospora]|uniref:U4/U6-U5 snRNP complex subunit prp31 n=1 Tax=Orbilia oligospora TaxID=2813651 RepID=A0A7C8NLW0_ORBOL|nr:U4/U6-U5 snRNP complex subunit prp31 [Orbilia oligospora]KAF3092776.1 U4/U6-U5 snRNP complex subunit prp31 [Orbilia oligospora]KAF3095142.1 U4/U6-U5 snRNP complex subunit prp31 [Orbilia oligospora]KAF3125086.1 U4/U6-U5 snRNP complex subunit prp31 [Orbilia oligospora]
MSLADELLADFDDQSDGEEEKEIDSLNTTLDPYADKSNGTASNSRHGMGIDGDGEDEEDEEMMDVGGEGDGDDGEDETQTKARIEKMQLGKVDDVRSIAKLMKVLEPVLEKIAYYQSQPTPTSIIGSVEQNPEYHLIVESNKHSVEIDSEIILVHKFIRDHYSPRYPELENLVTNPLDYAKTVAVIKNDLHLQPMQSQLRAVMDSATVMVVTVEATTSKGRQLSDKEIATVVSACEMTMALDRAKHTIINYVSSRMTLFAPNTSAIIGSTTAAQLIGFAGGLSGLAKMPACNISALGVKRRAAVTLASNVGIRQQGFLYHSPIIRQIPNDLKIKAMRIVSSKIVLAVRVDFAHEHTDGSMGNTLKQDILERLDKLTEPPPNKGPKALPAPDDKPARKRGGRRVRKAKEATAMTDLRKQQNRLVFGEAEREVSYGDSTKGMGMIGAQDSGKIRATKVDPRTRAKLSKNNLGWGTSAGGNQSVINPFKNTPGGMMSSFGVRSTASVSGTASSLAFTPVQGIELVDPKVKLEMERKRKAESDKWFQSGTFTQVGDQSKFGNKRVDTGEGKTTGLMLPPPAPLKKKI